MLIAAERAKLKRRIEFWEDEVTSIVFGPLSHMPADDVWSFIKSLSIGAGMDRKLFPATVPVSHSLHFWPTQSAGGDVALRVEPDVVFDFEAADGSAFHVLLEVKWRRGLSPKCELVRQWLTRPTPQENWIHLYLVSSREYGCKETTDSWSILGEGCENFNCCDKSPARFSRPVDAHLETRAWRPRLGVTSWRHILKEAQRLSSTAASTVVGRWATGVTAFLENQQCVPFVGFSWLSDPDYALLDEEEELEFFKCEPWFLFLGDHRFAILDDDAATQNFYQGGAHAG